MLTSTRTNRKRPPIAVLKANALSLVTGCRVPNSAPPFRGGDVVTHGGGSRSRDFKPGRFFQLLSKPISVSDESRLHLSEFEQYGARGDGVLPQFAEPFNDLPLPLEE
jgi:hypothetical protein